MIRKILLLSALVSVPLLGASKAQANNEYCREYTKTVTVGGRSEQAYGTACYRPDGSWEIVDLAGSNRGREQVRQVMYDDFQRDYRRSPAREVVVVERHARPYYSQYRRASYSPIVFSFGFGDYHEKKYVKKAKYKKHKKHHDHGRWGHHGYRGHYGHR